MPGDSEHLQLGLLARLSRRGVFRVGASYAVIAWLLLQIGDVVLDPFDFGGSAMWVLLIIVARPGHLRSQSGNEIQRFQYNMSRAVTEGPLVLVDDSASTVQ